MTTFETFGETTRNLIYAGLISVSSWGLQVIGKFEPLIDRTLFSMVQERFRTRMTPVQNLERASSFPLRVFVRCSACGTPLTGSFSTGRRGGQYGYYFSRTKECRAVKFRQRELDGNFSDLLRELALREDKKHLFRGAIESVCQKRSIQRQRALKESRKRVEELTQWREKIIEAWIDKRISKDVYEAQMEKVEQELCAAGLVEGDALLERAELELILGFAELMLDNAGYVWSTANYEGRLKIWWALFPGG